MRKFVYIYILLSLILISCGIRKKLSFTRRDFVGSSLRTDGFYYNKPDLAHFFLYRNGIIFDGGIWFNENFHELIDYYKESNNNSFGCEIPYQWGIFIMEKKEILIEKWVSGDAFGGYSTVQFQGEILNDTTLIINHPAEMIGRDTYYFQQFNAKPDSTNTFIK